VNYTVKLEFREVKASNPEEAAAKIARLLSSYDANMDLLSYQVTEESPTSTVVPAFDGNGA
jgi:hypothetical protein